MANLIDAESAGFESGTIGIWEIPVGTSGTLSNSTDYAHSGSHSLAIHLEEGQTAYIIETGRGDGELYSTTPGGLYKIESWLYVPPGATSDGLTFLGVDYWNDSLVYQGAALAWSEFVVEGWNHFLLDELELAVDAYWCSVFMLESWITYADEYRYFDDFFFGPVEVAASATATPPPLRQRQNPLRIKPTGAGGPT